MRIQLTNSQIKMLTHDKVLFYIHSSYAKFIHANAILISVNNVFWTHRTVKSVLEDVEPFSRRSFLSYFSFPSIFQYFTGKSFVFSLPSLTKGAFTRA